MRPGRPRRYGSARLLADSDRLRRRRSGTFPPPPRHDPACGDRQVIALTRASMKSISSGSRSYFAYNCWSISGIVLDQSMSEDPLKSCSGTNFHVLRGLCWVTFKTPSIVLANLDLRYLRQACASTSVSNEPMVIKV